MKQILKIAALIGFITLGKPTFADAWVMPSNECYANAVNSAAKNVLIYSAEEIQSNLNKLVAERKLITISEPKLQQFEGYPYETYKFGGRFIKVKQRGGHLIPVFMLQRSTADGDREDLIFDSRAEAEKFSKELQNVFIEARGNLCFTAISQATNLNDPRSLKKSVVVGYKIDDPTNPGKPMARYFMLPDRFHRFFADDIPEIFPTN